MTKLEKHNRPIRKKWDRRESIPPSRIPAASIMFSTFARIGMTQATVPLAIVVFICTTGPTIRLDGSFRKTSNRQKGKGGEESIIHS